MTGSEAVKYIFRIIASGNLLTDVRIVEWLVLDASDSNILASTKTMPMFIFEDEGLIIKWGGSNSIIYISSTPNSKINFEKKFNLIQVAFFNPQLKARLEEILKRANCRLEIKII